MPKTTREVFHTLVSAQGKPTDRNAKTFESPTLAEAIQGTRGLLYNFLNEPVCRTLFVKIYARTLAQTNPDTALPDGTPVMEAIMTQNKLVMEFSLEFRPIYLELRKQAERGVIAPAVEE